MLLMSFMKPWKDPDALGQRNQLDFVLDFFCFRIQKFSLLIHYVNNGKQIKLLYY